MPESNVMIPSVVNVNIDDPKKVFNYFKKWNLLKFVTPEDELEQTDFAQQTEFTESQYNQLVLKISLSFSPITVLKANGFWGEYENVNVTATRKVLFDYQRTEGSLYFDRIDRKPYEKEHQPSALERSTDRCNDPVFGLNTRQVMELGIIIVTPVVESSSKGIILPNEPIDTQSSALPETA